MVVELVVDRIVAGGTGLSELDGLKVFVPYSAPQERVRARFTVRKKDYAVAEVLEVIEPSPIRTEPRCPHFGTCGGCQLQHISYDGQLVVKKLILNDALQRLGHVFTPVRNITGETHPWRYRNKTQYPVGGTRQPEIGFFKQGTHQIVDVPECLLHPEAFDRLRRLTLELLRKTGESAYAENDHGGNVRHLVIRSTGADADCRAVVTVVTRTDSLAPALVEGLAADPAVAGIVHNVNRQRTNRILGTKSRDVHGETSLGFSVLGRTLRSSPGSFFQVNTSQAETLCRKILKHIAPEGIETVLDLYSGVGMIAISVAGFVKSVTGVEQHGPAVDDAEFNAAACGAGNVRFVRGDVDDAVTGLSGFDVVILDPPRKGCLPETLKSIATSKPRLIVYVSCNPATLARDLRVLAELNYHPTLIEPVDMFPQTSHVETVVSLTDQSQT